MIRERTCLAKSELECGAGIDGAAIEHTCRIRCDRMCNRVLIRPCNGCAHLNLQLSRLETGAGNGYRVAGRLGRRRSVRGLDMLGWRGLRRRFAAEQTTEACMELTG